MSLENLTRLAVDDWILRTEVETRRFNRDFPVGAAVRCWPGLDGGDRRGHAAETGTVRSQWVTIGGRQIAAAVEIEGVIYPVLTTHVAALAALNQQEVPS